MAPEGVDLGKTAWLGPRPERAIHYDSGKSPLDFLPLDLLDDLARHYATPALRGKYPRDNWREGGFRYGALIASAMRHQREIYLGRTHDLCEYNPKDCNTKGLNGTCNEHTGTPHAMAVVWNWMTLWYCMKNGLGENDLPGWNVKVQPWVTPGIEAILAGEMGKENVGVQQPEDREPVDPVASDGAHAPSRNVGEEDSDRAERGLAESTPDVAALPTIGDSWRLR